MHIGLDFLSRHRNVPHILAPLLHVAVTSHASNEENLCCAHLSRARRHEDQVGKKYSLRPSRELPVCKGTSVLVNWSSGPANAAWNWQIGAMSTWQLPVPSCLGQSLGGKIAHLSLSYKCLNFQARAMQVHKYLITAPCLSLTKMNKLCRMSGSMDASWHSCKPPQRTFFWSQTRKTRRVWEISWKPKFYAALACPTARCIAETCAKLHPFNMPQCHRKPLASWRLKRLHFFLHVFMFFFGVCISCGCGHVVPDAIGEAAKVKWTNKNEEQ